jgi:hypothetical protein
MFFLFLRKFTLIYIILRKFRKINLISSFCSTPVNIFFPKCLKTFKIFEIFYFLLTRDPFSLQVNLNLNENLKKFFTVLNRPTSLRVLDRSKASLA